MTARAVTMSDLQVADSGGVAAIASIIAAIGTLVVGVISAMNRKIGRRDSSKIEAVSDRLAEKMNEVLMLVQTFQSRFDRFEVGMTMRLERVEQQVANHDRLREEISKLQADTRILQHEILGRRNGD